MALASDIRSLVVKLLKAHSLRFMNIWQEADPNSGIKLTLLKFRRDKDHSPKAFFDALNENGIQYKKINKDPDAQEIICEIFPKGSKSRATQLRRKYREKEKQRDNHRRDEPTRNLSYIAVPEQGTASKMVDAIVRDLRAAGYSEDAAMVERVAHEHNQSEFVRKMRDVLRAAKLYQRPEIRQIREQIVQDMMSALGADSSLYKTMRSADLEKWVKDVFCDNIDLILDTRGVADSMLRRASASSEEFDLPKLTTARRRLSALYDMVGDADLPSSAKTRARVRVADARRSVDAKMRRLLSENPASMDALDPIVAKVVHDGIDSVFFELIESI
jgi:hypothetical protein